jgi:hypothetical protein
MPQQGTPTAHGTGGRQTSPRRRRHPWDIQPGEDAECPEAPEVSGP